MQNKELIDVFKKSFEIQTDVDVAFVFEESTATVASWRGGNRAMPAAVKFRLLDLIQYSPDIQKIAAVFVDIDQHRALLLQDLERVQDAQNRRKGGASSFINIKEIQALNELQNNEGLTDKQLATRLFMTEKELQAVKSGIAKMSLKTKLHVSSFIGYDKVRDRLIQMMPISAESKKNVTNTDNKIIRKNLNARAKK